LAIGSQKWTWASTTGPDQVFSPLINVPPAARFHPPKVTAFVAMLMDEHKRMAPTRGKCRKA
jgi:hypothetical protein